MRTTTIETIREIAIMTQYSVPIMILVPNSISVISDIFVSSKLGANMAANVIQAKKFCSVFSTTFARMTVDRKQHLSDLQALLLMICGSPLSALCFMLAIVFLGLLDPLLSVFVVRTLIGLLVGCWIFHISSTHGAAFGLITALGRTIFGQDMFAGDVLGAYSTSSHIRNYTTECFVQVG